MALDSHKPKCGCNVQSLLTAIFRLSIAKKRPLTYRPWIGQSPGITTSHSVRLFSCPTSRFLICRLLSARSVPLPSARRCQSSPTLNSAGQMHPKRKGGSESSHLRKGSIWSLHRAFVRPGTGNFLYRGWQSRLATLSCVRV